MEDGEHDDRMIRCPKVNGEGERLEQSSPNFAGYAGELERPFAYARECLIDIAEEPLVKPGALVLVPTRGILEIGLGERPNGEPAGHSCLAVVVELLPEAFLDDVPVVAGVRIDVELPYALVDDLAVPARNRDRLRRCRDSVPQRLQVVDFLVDRQVIEARRREWNGFRHGTSPVRFSICRHHCGLHHDWNAWGSFDRPTNRATRSTELDLVVDDDRDDLIEPKRQALHETLSRS